MVAWPLTLREGANDIEVRAAGGGEALADRVTWWHRKAPGMLVDGQ